MLSCADQTRRKPVGAQPATSTRPAWCPLPQGGHLDESDWERAPLPLGCVGAPYEVWCSTEGEVWGTAVALGRRGAILCEQRSRGSAPVAHPASVLPPSLLIPRLPADEAAPLHWLPPPLAWVAQHRIVALAGLELEQKQDLFPAHAQGSPYPSNALVVATLDSATTTASQVDGAGGRP